VGLTTHPPYTAEVKERVQLYLWALVACYRVNCTFTCTIPLMEETWYEILKNTYRKDNYYQYAENDEHRKFLE
jgi:hypothetical protein